MRASTVDRLAGPRAARALSACSRATTSPRSRDRSRRRRPPRRIRAAVDAVRATSASRWRSSSRGTATSPRTRSSSIDVDYDPIEPVLDPSPQSRPSLRLRPLVRLRRRRRCASPPPTSSSARRSAFPAGAARPSSATASSPTGTRPTGRSQPGRTSRARSLCTRSRRPRLACPATALRLHHPARLRRQLRDQGVGVHVRRAHRTRVAKARCPRPLDRGPAGAPRGERGCNRPHDRPRGGFTADGELLALRYDAIEDVGAYVRAPEPATLYRMHGSLSGAYRVRNVAARNRVVLTNRCPTGLNRGFGGPQLYFALERTMAIAARRLGLDPAELPAATSFRRRDFPYRTPSGGLYDSGDYEACLDDALELFALRRAPRRAGAPRAPRAGCRHRPRLRRRAVDLEHGLHHARADGRGTRAGAAEVRQRRGRDGRRSTRTAGSRSGSATTPQGQGHATVCRAGRRRRARASTRRRST